MDQYGISALPWKTYQHFFSEKSHTGMICGLFCDILGNWSLMFASISVQNSTSLKGRREGRQSYHTSTYFFPLQALLLVLSKSVVSSYEILWL